MGEGGGGLCRDVRLNISSEFESVDHAVEAESLSTDRIVIR